MKRIFLIVTIAFLALVYMNPLSASAALEDGTYTINYQVNKPDSSSASMANDYFAKPAKLIVQNGSMKIQLTIKSSGWVTEFNPPGGASVVSSNPGANQRVVQFSLSNFNPLRVNMKIDIDDISYHHSYGTDFVFFENSVTLVQAAAKPAQNQQSNAGNQSSNTNQNGATASNNAQNNNSAASSQANASSSSAATSQGVAQNNGATATENAAQNAQTDDQAQDEKQDAAEQEENPETADNFPYLYALLFIGAITLLVKNKNILKN